MTDFESAARITANQLEELEVQYALVGGFAVSILTEPRFTRDIDLVVAVDSDDGAEAVIWELVRNGYEVLAAVEQEVADGGPSHIGIASRWPDRLFAKSKTAATSGAETSSALSRISSNHVDRLATQAVARNVTTANSTPPASSTAG